MDPQHVSAAEEEPDDRTPVVVGVAAVSLLVLGWLVPSTLLWILVGTSIASIVVVIWFIPRFAIKIARENLGPGGILQNWRPSPRQAARVLAIVFLTWLPCGAASLVLFSLNGLLVQWSVGLAGKGIERLRDGLDVVDEQGRVTVEEAPWIVRKMLPGDGAELIYALESGIDGIQGALCNLLALLAFVLVVEGIVSIVFLVWLTVRAVMYLFARRVLSELASGEADGSLPRLHFRMGFDR